MKLLLACCVLMAAVLLTTMFLSSRSTAEREPIAAGHTLLDRGARAHDELDRADLVSESTGVAETASAPLARSATVTCVSSDDLPIDEVFLSNPDGSWQRVPAAGGRLERMKVDPAVFVRAPGHRATLIDKHASTIVLPVDALLVVRAAGLRACLEQETPRIAAVLPLSLTAACSLVFLDDDRLAFAVDTSLVSQDDRSGGVQVSLPWCDGRRSTVQFDARPGRRAEWQLECPSAGGSAPLDIRIEGDLAEDADIELRVTTSRFASEMSRAEQRVEPFTWGRVFSRAPERVAKEVMLRSTLPTTRFDAVRIGDRVDIIARDRTSRAFATASWPHDGLLARVVLKPPAVLAGRIATTDGSALPETISVAWNQASERKHGQRWRTLRRDVSVAADGSFRVEGPGHLEGYGEDLNATPTHADVEVSASGFEPAMCSFTFAGGPSGMTWRLTRRAPDLLVLTHEEGKDLALVVDGFALGRRIEEVRRGPARLEVVLGPELGFSAPEDLEFDSGPVSNKLPRPRPEIHLPDRFTILTSDQIHAFSRTDANVYRVEPSAHYELQVAPDPEGYEWYTGLQWKGTQVDGMTRTTQSQARHMTFTGPATDLAFTWSRGTRLPDGTNGRLRQSIALSPGSSKLSLSTPPANR